MLQIILSTWFYFIPLFLFLVFSFRFHTLAPGPHRYSRKNPAGFIDFSVPRIEISTCRLCTPLLSLGRSISDKRGRVTGSRRAREILICATVVLLDWLPVCVVVAVVFISRDVVIVLCSP